MTTPREAIEQAIRDLIKQQNAWDRMGTAIRYLSRVVRVAAPVWNELVIQCQKQAQACYHARKRLERLEHSSEELIEQ